MKDRLGNLLNIGDRCVCYNTMRTGSSTTRLYNTRVKLLVSQKRTSELNVWTVATLIELAMNFFAAQITFSN